MGGLNYGLYIGDAWGWPAEYCGLYPGFAAAANITVGSNPPYSVNDFLAVYPKFLGTPLKATMSLTEGSPNATLESANSAYAVGQLITGADVPAGTTIQSVNDTAVVLSANATATNPSEAVLIYTTPLVPVAVLNVYITLASASIMQSRWQDAWSYAMGLYVAHYATLWSRSDGDDATAKTGMSTGIAISKTVGDTSVSYDVTMGSTADWGPFNLTQYGQEFAWRAKAIGSGPMLIW